MAISNLTGTTWYMNETVNGTSLFTKSTWNISGQCDSYDGETWYGSFTAITTETTKIASQTRYSTNLIGYSVWHEGPTLTALPTDAPGTVMRYINITGGADATNSTLIAWFEANGTQILPPQTLATILFSINNPPYTLVPVNIVQKKSISSGSSITNLTGTTWLFNNDLGFFTWEYTFNINFTSNNTNYTILRPSAAAGSIMYRLNSSDLPGTEVYFVEGTPNPGGIYGWQLEAYRTITITGGIDATNSTLISLLQTAATFVSGDSLQPVLASHIGTSIATIQFTIGNVTYQAEEDMTWYEWVNSDYNTGGYACPNVSQNIHSTNLSNYMVGKGSNYVYRNYVITPNCAYTLIGGGAGN